MFRFSICAQSALEFEERGWIIVTYTDLVTYFRARLSAEEGQTMAEYGVVLAVIAAIVVAALVALQGGITGAIDRVTSFL